MALPKKRHGFFAAILAISVAAAPSLAASTDCFEQCIAGAGCGGIMNQWDSTRCSDATSRCQSTCLNTPAAKSYGAIAYSKKNGGYGYSNGQTDRKEAEKTALKYCKQHGKNCKVEVWFNNGCGAVVTSDEKGFLGIGSSTKVFWGIGSTPWNAQQNAMAACQKAGKKHCEAKVTHCSR